MDVKELGLVKIPSNLPLVDSDDLKRNAQISAVLSSHPPPSPLPPQQLLSPAHRHLALLRTADWRQSVVTPLPRVNREAALGAEDGVSAYESFPPLILKPNHLCEEKGDFLVEERETSGLGDIGDGVFCASAAASFPPSSCALKKIKTSTSDDFLGVPLFLSFFSLSLEFEPNF